MTLVRSMLDQAEACIQALRTGVLPPTANVDDPAPDCVLDHVRGVARRSPADRGLEQLRLRRPHVTLVFEPRDRERSDSTVVGDRQASVMLAELQESFRHQLLGRHESDAA